MRIKLSKISGVVVSFVAALLGPLFNATVAPAQILGEQDGQWDRNSCKTDAFFGNPLNGFIAP